MLLISYSCLVSYLISAREGGDIVQYYQGPSFPCCKRYDFVNRSEEDSGGRELGTECCEVVVDYIMKKDAILFRPVGNVTTIGQAQGRTIAWLYKHVRLYFLSSFSFAEMVKSSSLPIFHLCVAGGAETNEKRSLTSTSRMRGT